MRRPVKNLKKKLKDNSKERAETPRILFFFCSMKHFKVINEPQTKEIYEMQIENEIARTIFEIYQTEDLLDRIILIGQFKEPSNDFYGELEIYNQKRKRGQTTDFTSFSYLNRMLLWSYDRDEHFYSPFVILRLFLQIFIKFYVTDAHEIGMNILKTGKIGKKIDTQDILHIINLQSYDLSDKKFYFQDEINKHPIFNLFSNNPLILLEFLKIIPFGEDLRRLIIRNILDCKCFGLTHEEIGSLFQFNREKWLVQRLLSIKCEDLEFKDYFEYLRQEYEKDSYNDEIIVKDCAFDLPYDTSYSFFLDYAFDFYRKRKNKEVLCYIIENYENNFAVPWTFFEIAIQNNIVPKNKKLHQFTRLLRLFEMKKCLCSSLISFVFKYLKKVRGVPDNIWLSLIRTIKNCLENRQFTESSPNIVLIDESQPADLLITDSLLSLSDFNATEMFELKNDEDFKISKKIVIEILEVLVQIETDESAELRSFFVALI